MHLLHGRVQIRERPRDVLEQFPDEHDIAHDLVQEASYGLAQAFCHFVYQRNQFGPLLLCLGGGRFLLRLRRSANQFLVKLSIAQILDGFVQLLVALERECRADGIVHECREELALDAVLDVFLVRFELGIAVIFESLAHIADSLDEIRI